MLSGEERPGRSPISTTTAQLLSAPATAALITVTDFTTDAAGVTVVSTPPDDLLAASLISAAAWTAETVAIPLGGLAHGDLVTLTNPIHLAVGSTIAISWDGGMFHDITTIGSITPSSDALALDATGELFGPGVGANKSNLNLSWTQAGGTGFAISGSGSYTATSVVPETSTWAMMMIGFASLAFGAVTRRRFTQRLESY